MESQLERHIAHSAGARKRRFSPKRRAGGQILVQALGQHGTNALDRVDGRGRGNYRHYPNIPFWSLVRLPAGAVSSELRITADQRSVVLVLRMMVGLYNRCEIAPNLLRRDGGSVGPSRSQCDGGGETDLQLLTPNQRSRGSVRRVDRCRVPAGGVERVGCGDHGSGRHPFATERVSAPRRRSRRTNIQRSDAGGYTTCSVPMMGNGALPSKISSAQRSVRSRASRTSTARSGMVSPTTIGIPRAICMTPIDVLEAPGASCCCRP